MNMNKVIVKIDKDFTVIPNEIIRNKEMSCNAKMILITMLSLPPEWDYSVAGLSKIFKEGRDTVRNALEEIEKFGYITRKRERLSNGTLGLMIYTVYQFPVPKTERTYKTRGFEPKTEIPTLAKPKMDSKSQYNTNNKIKNQENKKHNSAIPLHECDFDLEIMQRVTEITADETIIDGIQFYLDTYRRYMGKNHPSVSKSALKDIIYNIETVLQDEWEDVVNYEGLTRMIKRHFKTEYGESIDYNLVHFGTEKILEYQARNVGLITGWRD